MVITENLTIRGLNVQKNKHVHKIGIVGKYDINVSKSKFDGLGIFAIHSANVEISGVKFLISPVCALRCYNCIAIIMQSVFARNCRNGFDITNRFPWTTSSVVASNINVQQCQFVGFYFDHVPSFEITNVEICECRTGIVSMFSKGNLRDVVVRECLQHGIFLEDSQVRHGRFLCINNGGHDVFLMDVGSTFIQEDQVS
eukprot:TRINITY_DN1128_c2_g1_i2.p1 TRINITY_DN1128_c2_g1~~TRINITY_DN1128_c2_g1_i2.p1  ORF type:complete len:226 (+),score=10.20 TRINITY_DN1128_c2_g1_i2:83-679(+)